VTRCLERGCRVAAERRGLCFAHYQRARRAGTLEPVRQPNGEAMRQVSVHLTPDVLEGLVALAAGLGCSVGRLARELVGLGVERAPTAELARRVMRRGP
jgi:hypothetical protein